MKRSYLPLLMTAVFAICIAVGESVHAGSADAPTSSPAAVKGVVKFEGNVTKPKHIEMSADPQCAKAHPGGATIEEVITDGSGDLENVVVYVADGLGDRTFAPPEKPAVIEQKGCLYQPHVVTMQANQKLEVVNDDPTTHNIHPMPKNNREWNKSQPPGVPIEETFAREEVAIPVKCNVHPWMRSDIAVVKNPYFAVTGKNGSFELPNLPPGTYTIEAWHEKLGTQTQKITVGPSETKTVNFVFKSLPGY